MRFLCAGSILFARQTVPLTYQFTNSIFVLEAPVVAAARSVRSSGEKHRHGAKGWTAAAAVLRKKETQQRKMSGICFNYRKISACSRAKPTAGVSRNDSIGDLLHNIAVSVSAFFFFVLPFVVDFLRVAFAGVI